MDRHAAAQAIQSIREHAEIAATFLADPLAKDRALELELLNRCNQIEAKNALLRSRIMDRSGRPDSSEVAA